VSPSANIIHEIQQSHFPNPKQEFVKSVHSVEAIAFNYFLILVCFLGNIFLCLFHQFLHNATINESQDLEAEAVYGSICQVRYQTGTGTIQNKSQYSKQISPILSFYLYITRPLAADLPQMAIKWVAERLANCTFRFSLFGLIITKHWAS
jgi:hypothetical protein